MDAIIVGWSGHPLIKLRSFGWPFRPNTFWEYDNERGQRQKNERKRKLEEEMAIRVMRACRFRRYDEVR